jgi:hypothetical protein
MYAGLLRRSRHEKSISSLLKSEPKTLYAVYPSWASYEIDWQTLKPHVQDPLNSNLLDATTVQWIAHKKLRPQNPEPIETLDGPAGGGIVIEHLRTAPPGLVWYVFNEFAEGAAPLGVNGVRADRSEHVCYLQPARKLYGFGRRPPKVYDLCYISFEHAESAGESLYWVVDFTGKKEIAGLDEVSGLANGFGLEANRPEAEPPELASEVPELLALGSDWYSWLDHRLVWYRVSGGREGIGYQFAIIVYVALHLRKVAGRAFKTMHLIGQVETKARFRSKWQFHPRNPILKKPLQEER